MDTSSATDIHSNGEHPLDAYVHDPSGLAPLCDEQRFAELLAGMVADNAPRLFAVVREYGVRVDGTIAGWGLAFEDRVEVVSTDGGLRMRTASTQRAVQCFGFGTHITPRLVWFDPAAATPEEGIAG